MNATSYYAGIDLGGTFIKCGIVSESGVIVKSGKIATTGAYEEVVKSMSELALSLAQEVGVSLAGIGVGCPGTIDGKTGIVSYSNNLGWEQAPLGIDLQSMTGIPVAITNDANAAALGEAAFGAGKNYKDTVLITLGTGVGSGIVIDGKLFEGKKGAGAELGHTVIKMNGEPCTCGRKGCLEAYASARALVNQAKASMRKNKDTLLWELCEGDIEKMNGKLFFEGLKSKDKVAKRVYRRYLDYLACGLTNIANAFRPSAILLGGGISAVGETLTMPLQRRMAKQIFGGQRYAPVRIVKATLENDAGILGAAKLVMP